MRLCVDLQYLWGWKPWTLVKFTVGLLELLLCFVHFKLTCISLHSSSILTDLLMLCRGYSNQMNNSCFDFFVQTKCLFVWKYIFNQPITADAPWCSAGFLGPNEGLGSSYRVLLRPNQPSFSVNVYLCSYMDAVCSTEYGVADIRSTAVWDNNLKAPGTWKHLHPSEWAATDEWASTCC